jgi:hypothetical protein
LPRRPISDEREHPTMFRLTFSYIRYALTALSTVAFGTSLN